MNFVSNCPRMNAPYLESPDKFYHLFLASLHKIKLYIFQNISKFLINGLRPFKYKNVCELCDNILDKEKRGRIMFKKGVVLHEEVIDAFYDFFTSPQ